MHRIYDAHLTNIENDNTATDERRPKKKITIEVDEDDPCLKQEEKTRTETSMPGDDPRFQQQNQTLRCWVMYTDFYRCKHILGEETSACNWFKQVFTSICPNLWIHHWDNLRAEGKFPWHKGKTQGEFPGDKYGV
ncbi:Cytochrome c oxidase subunit 6B1 [Habropoda laboriosa]|uniref:Cytochrome c oxidase subunit 6B1 n=2 Tax=Habropoda laboriosa TaxID=597456 RepID=A0A0L7R808_9HYME|nr:Cytochrome c oxidase subunit 6B1 [Habropoda laboriosa]